MFWTCLMKSTLKCHFRQLNLYAANINNFISDFYSIPSTRVSAVQCILPFCNYAKNRIATAKLSRNNAAVGVATTDRCYDECEGWDMSLEEHIHILKYSPLAIFTRNICPKFQPCELFTVWNIHLWNIHNLFWNIHLAKRSQKPVATQRTHGGEPVFFTISVACLAVVVWYFYTDVFALNDYYIYCMFIVHVYWFGSELW